MVKILALPNMLINRVGPKGIKQLMESFGMPAYYYTARPVGFDCRMTEIVTGGEK